MHEDQAVNSKHWTQFYRSTDGSVHLFPHWPFGLDGPFLGKDLGQIHFPTATGDVNVLDFPEFGPLDQLETEEKGNDDGCGQVNLKEALDPL